MAEVTDYDFEVQSTTGAYKKGLVHVTGDSGDTVVLDGNNEKVDSVLSASCWDETQGQASNVTWSSGDKEFTFDTGNGTTGNDFTIEFLFE